MLQPGRKYTAGTGYRYGFNGKENDNEVKGEGNQQDYGLRIYDPRLGKFLSVDPLTKKYPMLSTYQFASNSPIAGIDLDGGEFKYYALDRNQKPVLITAKNKQVLTFVSDGLEATPTNTQNDPVVVAGTVTIALEVNEFTVWTWNVNFKFKMSDLGIQANVVNVNGINRVLPEGADLDELPDTDDEYWDGLETEDTYLSRIQVKAKEIGDKATLSGLPFTIRGSKRGLIQNHFSSGVGSIAKPIQIHHFASNKNKKYTSQFKKIASKYGLDLDGDWNKQAVGSPFFTAVCS